MPTKTLVDVLTRTEQWLGERGVDSPRLDAELLVGHVLGMERLQLYLSFDRPFSEAELAKLRPLVRRRGAREPLAWITGTKGFHAIDLVVPPGVLVPRPDTETLVEAMLCHLPEGEGEPIYLADVGCGTGAVGLAIAFARPRVRLFAIDLSEAARANTRENVQRLGMQDRVAVLDGDLLDPIPEQRPIDWVVSNPPYIPSADIDGLMPEVSEHEPRLALDGGVDGLDLVRRLAISAFTRARCGLYLEIGHDQSRATGDILTGVGFVQIETHPDLAGIQRVVGGVKPGSSP